MDIWSLELIGLMAGATNLFSSVPQLVANLREPDRAHGQSPARNAYQCVGNALWLVYGTAIGSIAMMLFSTLGCLMATVLLCQVLKAHRRFNAGALELAA
ncbi:MAG: hypothetical protein OXQ92_04175 [Boseongicola sp.]|nr:hypothetical protein [Boseongicola sp.]MDD9979720.1 hypothetical protein [Boseongicola sp.]